MQNQWVIVSDDGFLSNREHAWVNDKELVTLFDSNEHGLPIGPNCRYEKIVYVSERGTWYTEAEMIPLVRQTALYKELAAKFNHEIVEEVLIRYTLNLVEWQEPATLLDEAYHSYEEKEVLNERMTAAENRRLAV